MGTHNERRSSGLLRVPFVQICSLEYSNGRKVSGFLVNINVLGAYVAADKGEFPSLGERLVCHFHTPDNHTEMGLPSSIAWVNAHQPHPVHSLPPGFGLKFENLQPDHKLRIQRIVEDYVKRHPQMR